MATQSILKNISIRDKKSARDLVNALENAENKKSKEVVLSKPLKKIEKEDIAELWKRN